MCILNIFKNLKKKLKVNEYFRSAKLCKYGFVFLLLLLLHDKNKRIKTLNKQQNYSEICQRQIPCAGKIIDMIQNFFLRNHEKITTTTNNQISLTTFVVLYTHREKEREILIIYWYYKL